VKAIQSESKRKRDDDAEDIKAVKAEAVKAAA
jgi:hypothetical protein